MILNTFSTLLAQCTCLTRVASGVYQELPCDCDIAISRPQNIVHITDLGKLIGSAVGVILILAALLAFVFLIMGGIQWITSGGDKAGVEAAQKKIQAAVIGLVIVFAVWALFSLITNFLGIGNILEKGINLPSPIGP